MGFAREGLFRNRTNRESIVTIIVIIFYDERFGEVQVAGFVRIARAERRRPIATARTAKVETRTFDVTSSGEEKERVGLV